MKSAVVSLLVVAVCAALFFTNPSEKDHKQAVHKQMADQLGMTGFLSDVVESGLNRLDALDFRYRNYFFFSQLTYDDETVSFGVLNNVWADEEVDKILGL